MKKRWLYGIVFVWFLISFIYDKQLAVFVSLLRVDFLDVLFVWITNPLTVIFTFFVITLALLIKKKKRWIIPVWLSIGLSALVSLVMKVLILRQRPFQFLELPLIQGADYAFRVWDSSFPSMHAAVVFALIPILSKGSPKIKFSWIVLACLIAFSRVYIGVHYFSDIIMGGVIGLLAGKSILYLKEKHKLFKK